MSHLWIFPYRRDDLILHHRSSSRSLFQQDSSRTVDLVGFPLRFFTSLHVGRQVSRFVYPTLSSDLILSSVGDTASFLKKPGLCSLTNSPSPRRPVPIRPHEEVYLVYKVSSSMYLVYEKDLRTLAYLKRSQLLEDWEVARPTLPTSAIDILIIATSPSLSHLKSMHTRSKRRRTEYSNKIRRSFGRFERRTNNKLLGLTSMKVSTSASRISSCGRREALKLLRNGQEESYQGLSPFSRCS